MSGPSYSCLHRVVYAECTLGNHVYYSRYLDWLEEARGELFRSLEIPFLKLQSEGIQFPVLECSVRYKSPARYDDLLSIDVWVITLGPVRLEFAYRISNDIHRLILEARTLHVCASLNEKPKRLPKAVAEKLKPFWLIHSVNLEA